MTVPSKALVLELVSDELRVVEDPCRILYQSLTICILAVHAIPAHVSDNLADVEGLHEFDRFWQLPAAGAVRMLVDESSAILGLQLIELDREPHVSHCLFPECVLFLWFHPPFVQTMQKTECGAHGATYEKCRLLLNDMSGALGSLSGHITIPCLTVLVIDLEVARES